MTTVSERSRKRPQQLTRTSWDKPAGIGSAGLRKAKQGLASLFAAALERWNVVCCSCTSSSRPAFPLAHYVKGALRNGSAPQPESQRPGALTRPSLSPFPSPRVRTSVSRSVMADAERVMSSAQASTSGRDDGKAEAAAPGAESAHAAAPPAVAFTKKARRGNMRKRPAEADADAEAAGAGGSEGPSVVRKQRARADNPLAFTTKRPEEDKPEVFTFQSSRTLQQTTDQRATATLDIETDFAHDARCASSLCIGVQSHSRRVTSTRHRPSLNSRPAERDCGACVRHGYYS